MGFEGNIKGIHLVNVLRYIKYKRGLLGINVFFNKINEGKIRKDMIDENHFIEKEWYPYELFLEFLKYADLVIGIGNMTSSYDIGFYTVQNMGHLNYLVRTGDIFEFGQLTDAHWNNLYDFGKLKWNKLGEKKLSFAYHGFPKDRAICDYFRGSLSGMLNLCNLQGKIEELKCNTKNDDFCEFIISWD